MDCIPVTRFALHVRAGAAEIRSEPDSDRILCLQAVELLRDKRRAEFHAQLLEQQVLHLNVRATSSAD